MAEEVEIKVRQTSEGDAIAQTQAKIQELYKTAAAYESKGGMETAAKSARQEAQSLEKDLAKFAKERANEERNITRERTKQAAEEKLSTRRSTRIAGAAVNFAERQAGASGFSGLTSMLGAVGGVPGMIVKAVVAIGVGLAAAFAKQKDQREILGMEDSRARVMQERRLRRAAGFEGSAESSRSDAEGFKDQLLQGNSSRDILQKKAAFKWYNPAGWVDKMTGASENEIFKNEKDIKLAEEGLTKARQTQKTKWAENGAAELKAMEARTSGLRKEAQDIERTRQWTADYNAALNGGADENSGDASRLANAKMHERMVQQGRAIGGKLGSGAGAAEIARVAAIASNPNGEVKESISHLTAFLRGQHDETANKAWRHKFERTLNR